MAGPDERFRAGVIEVAPDASVHPSARLRAHEIRLGPGVHVGQHTRIRAGRIALGEGTRLDGDSSMLFVDRIEIGPFGRVESGASFRGRSLRAGRHFYVGRGVTIGGGGAMGLNARFVAGHGVGIYAESLVNLAHEVMMGDRSALSQRVTILTHGSWDRILDGYSSQVAPVRIGDDAVVYYGATILPGCDVGEGAVVGAVSLVNRTVPPHCLVAGNPARVRRRDYPQQPDAVARVALVENMLACYAATLDDKGFTDVEHDGQVRARFQGESYCFHLGMPCASDSIDVGLCFERAAGPLPPRTTFVELLTPGLLGYRDAVIEDFRDHLRRSGIRILDGGPFVPLPPAALGALPSLD